MWSRGSDPDNAAIPYLTAIGDLLGTGFLTIAFIFLQLGGDSTIRGLQTDHNETLSTVLDDTLNATLVTSLSSH